MGGVCDEVFEGTAEEIAEKGKAHVMGATDDAHKELGEKMKTLSEEDHKKWWENFQKQFAAKPDA